MRYSLFALFLLALATARAKPLDLGRYGISPKALEKFQLKEKDGGGSAEHQFVGEDFVLQIQTMGSMERRSAGFLQKRELIAVRSLYAEQKTPYPGQITRLLKCSPEFAFQELAWPDKENAMIFIGGTSERKVFGACSATEIGWVGLHAGFYHPAQKTYLRIRGFKKFKPGSSWADQVEKMKSWVRELVP